jgi:hypothetical protein
MPFCPHCNRNTFEILAVDVGGTKYNCVQCSGCKGSVVRAWRQSISRRDYCAVSRAISIRRRIATERAGARLIRLSVPRRNSLGR